MLDKYIDVAILETVYTGNTVLQYIEAVLLFLGIFIVLELFKKVALRKLKKVVASTDNIIDDVLVTAVDSVRPYFYWFIAFYLATRTLNAYPLAHQTIYVLLVFAIVIQIVSVISVFIDYFARKSAENESSVTALNAVKIMVKIVIWILGLLLILSNLGVDITSLVAGLGIGGVAIALAIQNILEDLFSSFAIYFDKPFEIGDSIEVGESKGTVEKIGVKTTRMRAYDGEEIVISNKELTSARIRNFKRLSERRVLCNFGLTYDTPNEKIEKIPAIIEEEVGKIEKARFERAHFITFGDSALNFEVVYFVESSDYTEYMDVNQAVNLKIKAAFEAEEIEMAFPTRTLLMKKEA